MSDLGLVLPIGMVSVVVFLFLRRIDDSPVTAHWANAWIALYSAGILAGANVYSVWAGFLAQIPLQLFAGFLLAGALSFAGLRVPSWIVPLAIVLGGLRTLQAALGGESAVYLTTLVTVPPFVGTAAWVLWRKEGSGRWRSPEGWLAPLITAIALMTVIDPLARLFQAPTLPLYVGWISTALAVAFVQLMVVEERVHSRRDELLRALEYQADLLGEERSRLRALIDASPAGIMFIDRDGMVGATNPILLEHLGEGPEKSWVGLHSRDVEAACVPRVAPESRVALRECLRGMQSESPARVEGLEIHLLEPADRVLRMYSAPLRSSSDRLQGQLWISLDVTQERRLSQQLHESRRMETLGTLAGGVAHDFNNHLTPVLGNAWLLRQSLDENDPLQAVARDIEEAAQHCADMTRDLLTVAHRAPANAKPVDTLEALEKAAAHFGRHLTPNETVSLEVEKGVPPVLADAEQLARVLENVLGNARDAIEGRGEIHLHARSDHADDGSPKRVMIEIRDDGHGMDEDTRHHIFEPFFTTKDVGAGSGLGLAIASGIIEAHGGEIEVSSQPDTGTRIRIRWPAAKEPVESTPSVSRRSTTSEATARPAISPGRLERSRRPQRDARVSRRGGALRDGNPAAREVD
ncbi:MAG: PAS domain-containing protein [Deltaproteobacteria bacterium]|nr:PAS domain-containing protein [Deltaproteobacteria bacterium]